MLDKKTHNRKKCSGFTLIEVLIAMFVLSVGMLGSTSLMLQGRAEAKRINYESKAMQLAMGMAEQIRANINGANTNAYDNVNTANATDPGCIANTCTLAQMAAYDAFIWRQALQSNLPGGAGTVAVRFARGNDDVIYTINISWTQTRKTSATTGEAFTRNYTMIFQP
jgi:type IV pilus assembly protein PilV